MNVVVRRIRPEDGRVLAAVRLAALADAPSAFGSTYAAEVAFTDHVWRERATAWSDGPGGATFLAVHDDRTVGIVGAYRAGPAATTVELVSMWTAPDARRAGVARRLVQAVVDWARSTDARRVELWVTRGNDAAHALYESMGFRDTGASQPLPSDPCKDETRMALPLAPG